MAFGHTTHTRTAPSIELTVSNVDSLARLTLLFMTLDRLYEGCYTLAMCHPLAPNGELAEEETFDQSIGLHSDLKVVSLRKQSPLHMVVEISREFESYYLAAPLSLYLIKKRLTNTRKAVMALPEITTEWNNKWSVAQQAKLGRMKSQDALNEYARLRMLREDLASKGLDQALQATETLTSHFTHITISGDQTGVSDNDLSTIDEIFSDAEELDLDQKAIRVNGLTVIAKDLKAINDIRVQTERLNQHDREAES